MTPGVVEIERQRFRVPRDADPETVVVRVRTLPNFIDCAGRRSDVAGSPVKLIGVTPLKPGLPLFTPNAFTLWF